VDIESRARELYAQLEQEKNHSKSWLHPLGLPAPALKLAKFMMKQGKREWAARFAQLSLDIYPRTKGARAILGQVAFDNGNDDVAIAHLLRAASESPRNQDVLRALGIAYRRKGEIVRAAGYLQRAVNAVGSVENWISLADVLAMGGDADNAARAYRKGLQQEPARPSSWLKLATLLSLQGKHDDAIDALREGTIHNEKDFELLSRLAKLLAANGIRNEAKSYALKALAIRPNDKEMLEITGKD
jgi:Flp pilus assembly protein TadD